MWTREDYADMFAALAFMTMACIVALSSSCGPHTPELPPCEDALAACEYYANHQSGSRLVWYARVYECASDFGACISDRDTCSEDCQMTYSWTSCNWQCTIPTSTVAP